MLRLLLTADVHVKAERLPTFRQLFADIATLVTQNQIDMVLFLGDMWHEKHYVESQVLNCIYQGGLAIKKAGAQVVWVRGNHEVEVKSHPHERSFIGLFGSVYKVISKKAEKLNTKCGYDLWCVPWFQPERFKKEVLDVSRQPGDKLLFSHVAINEGFVSASNSYRPETGVALKDMRTDSFGYIFLGDYHHNQYLGENLMYLGCPIPLAHGDVEHGVWLLEIGDNHNEFTPIGLPSQYPQFVKHDFSNGSRPIEYSDTNYNHFTVRQSDIDGLKRLYTGANDTWDVVAEEEQTAFRGRATAEELATPVAAFEKWLKIRNLGDQQDLRELGLEYLERNKIGR